LGSASIYGSDTYGKSIVRMGQPLCYFC
jgi:hypothetical protein